MLVMLSQLINNKTNIINNCSQEKIKILSNINKTNYLQSQLTLSVYYI